MRSGRIERLPSSNTNGSSLPTKLSSIGFSNRRASSPVRMRRPIQGENSTSRMCLMGSSPLKVSALIWACSVKQTVTLFVCGNCTEVQCLWELYKIHKM